MRLIPKTPKNKLIIYWIYSLGAKQTNYTFIFMHPGYRILNLCHNFANFLKCRNKLWTVHFVSLSNSQFNSSMVFTLTITFAIKRKIHGTLPKIGLKKTSFLAAKFRPYFWINFQKIHWINNLLTSVLCRTAGAWLKVFDQSLFNK